MKMYKIVGMLLAGLSVILSGCAAQSANLKNVANSNVEVLFVDNGVDGAGADRTRGWYLRDKETGAILDKVFSSSKGTLQTSLTGAGTGAIVSTITGIATYKAAGALKPPVTTDTTNVSNNSGGATASATGNGGQGGTGGTALSDAMGGVANGGTAYSGASSSATGGVGLGGNASSGASSNSSAGSSANSSAGASNNTSVGVGVQVDQGQNTLVNNTNKVSPPQKEGSDGKPAKCDNPPKKW